jgi:serine/threonine protein kinase
MHILKRLKHINIVRLINHKIDTEKGLFQIIMEYCNGGTLYESDIIRYYFPEKLDRLKYMLVQMFVALDYIHNLKIIHGDLKPDNILIS